MKYIMIFNVYLMYISVYFQCRILLTIYSYSSAVEKVLVRF